MTTTQGDDTTRPGWAETLAVYLRPRVLIVMFLGFSSGLPLALTGSTLLYWAAEAKLDLRTIGLFALVGTPYTFKFIWAPLVDAFDVPILGRLGRRRGWLVFSQLILIATIVFLGSLNPATAPGLVALGAVAVAAASATQDIVIDAFRVDSLPESEQAAGLASYVAAYRVGMLASGAGALYAVSVFEEGLGLTRPSAWTGSYATMAVLVVVGIVTTLVATEPERSARAAQAHQGMSPFRRLFSTVIGAFGEFFLREGILIALVVLAFVILFKLTDALAGVMTGPFTVQLGFTRNEYATIIKGVGLAATLIGGFAGGYVARAFPMATSLWIGGIVQALANFAFVWQAEVGRDLAWLTFAITVENFTSAIGTVIFVAYLSALCKNPLHTATQFALFTAFSAFGRTYLSATAGSIAQATGWAWFFAICAVAAIPGFLLLAFLQQRGHFASLKKPSVA